ncbi:MAG: hypothetical protein JXB49_30065 [Bacteroidales bacterium]|nr:hypothetical protein [Bacteroidales bacterium]
MGLFKKIGSAIKKAIKPNGLVSKIVSKIPVVGGIASGAIDIVGGIVNKATGSKTTSTASKPTAAETFVKSYQDVTGAAALSAAESSMNLESKAQSPITTGIMKYLLLGGAAIAGMFLIFKRK